MVRASTHGRLAGPVSFCHIRQNLSGYLHGLPHVVTTDEHFAKNLVPKRFNKGQAIADIHVIDLGGAIVEVEEIIIDGNNRANALGQMGDCAVGLAVPHDRAIGPAGHVHQQHR